MPHTPLVTRIRGEYLEMPGLRLTLEQAQRGRLLLRLATSRGRKDRIGRRDAVRVSVSHNELAQLAGMTRPHVTVTTGRLRLRRLVQYDREGQVRVDVASAYRLSRSHRSRRTGVSLFQLNVDV